MEFEHKQRKRKNASIVYCTHCDCDLSWRTVKVHIRNFWNETEQRWNVVKNKKNPLPSVHPLTGEPIDRDQSELLMMDDDEQEHKYDGSEDDNDANFGRVDLRQRIRSLANDPELSSAEILNELMQIQFVQDELDESNNADADDIDVVDEDNHDHDDNDSDDDNADGSDEEEYLLQWNSRIVHANDTCRTVLIFLVLMKLWQVRFKISNRAFDALFQILTCFWEYADIISEQWIVKPHSNVSKRIDRILNLKNAKTEQAHAICPQCFKLHDTSILSNKHQELCTECSAAIMEPTCNKKKTWIPSLLYVTIPLLTHLASFFARPNFLEKIEHWRTRVPISGVLTDIYDGTMWRDEYQYDSNGRALLAAAHTLCFMLHVDWVSPFEYSNYSVGIVFLVILNLPRELRFKVENVILIGVIPGGSEKDGNKLLNQILLPFVNELLLLWEGVEIAGTLVRGFLALICCDLPAVRKLIGATGCQ